ncbi:hypothetical protein PIB30_035058 [Stylosanthes scabra]|uniref:GATA-type domain-containing protein n=1 Tax=Stylosanthes scabra TaxID=79078 RepID=A0ABU6YFE7_9FABA|nr:hypothetical protein [Stylosanthes scabra]
MKEMLKNNTENKNNNNNNNECSSKTLINTCPSPSSNERCFVASICSFGSDGTARGMLGGRRRRRRLERGVLLQSDDPNRYCTNYYCRTTRTPMWRKGPLGFKVTLCNACGIDYMKQVTSRGSGITTTLPDFSAELGSDHSNSEGSADV